MKQIIKQIKNYLPKYFKKKIGEKVQNKKLKQHRERKQRINISLDEINIILEKLNLNQDLIIHSSISNIGKIEGGAKQLTELILSKIDLSSKTVIVPALPFLGSQKEYLDNLKYFNLQEAKNAMGNISNIIMRIESSQRSFHPTHSVVSIGNEAEYYIKDHEKCKTPFCIDSPYRKITDNNGKILMFGVNLNSVTNFHVYEDMLGEFLPFDIYSKKLYIVKSINKDKEINIEVKVHNPFLSAKRDCERARKYLIKNKCIETYKLGDSEVSLLNAKGLTITLLEMLLKGDSIYGKVKLNDKQSKYVESLLKDFR